MDKNIVIYDGDCGICEKFRKVALKLDWFDSLVFRPFQDQNIYSNFTQLKPDECEKELKFITKKGKLFGGGDAVVSVLLRLPILFLFALVLWSPPFRYITNALYPKLAKSRHRFGSSCQSRD